MKRNISYALSLILALGILSSGAAFAQGQCPGEVAEKWAQSLDGNLPTDFEKVSELPIEYRKAIYRRLSFDDQSRLWREQFDFYLNNYELSDAQQAVLFDALQMVTPTALMKLGSGKTPAWLISLEQRAREAFGSDLARLVLARLGKPEAEIRTYVDVPHAGLVKPSLSAKQVTSRPACTCSDASDYCDSGFSCVAGSNNCVRIDDECGTFWTYDCDGLCEVNTNPTPTQTVN